MSSLWLGPSPSPRATRAADAAHACPPRPWLCAREPAGPPHTAAARPTPPPAACGAHHAPMNPAPVLAGPDQPVRHRPARLAARLGEQLVHVRFAVAYADDP